MLRPPHLGPARSSLVLPGFWLGSSPGLCPFPSSLCPVSHREPGQVCGVTGPQPCSTPSGPQGDTPAASAGEQAFVPARGRRPGAAGGAAAPPGGGQPRAPRAGDTAPVRTRWRGVPACVERGRGPVQTLSGRPPTQTEPAAAVGAARSGGGPTEGLAGAGGQD